MSSNAGIRLAAWGIGFCHIFGLIGVVVFGLAMLIDILYVIGFLSSIASLIVRQVSGGWFGFRSIWSGFPLSWEINPNQKYFSPREVRNTSVQLIVFGIITLPGSFLIGGALLLIGGFLLITQAASPITP